ncbi:MAG: ATP-binding protein, partial [Arenicellales bacterium]|nr:ATP-binding protein [Arenicellales bacterium]
RLEGDLSTESRTQVDIGSLLEDIIESLNFQATQEEKEVRLELRADSQLSGDAELLRRAFENVIGNAVKYTPPKSVVSVTLAKSDSTITVSVSDQGPGIDESKLKTIFEPFSRITNQNRFRDDPAQKSDERGFGLGLTIADRAIRRHHGTIRAFNLEEGGLSIVITLPAATQNQSISRGYK